MRVTLQVTSGPNAGDVFAFDEHATFLVGRSSEAHVRIPDQDLSASRNHCLIEINPPHCQLLDLDSRNGTFVNQKRAARAVLRSGDLIQAGTTRLEVVIDSLAPSSPDPSSPSLGSSIADPPDLRPYGWIIDRELGRGRMGPAYRARRLDVDDEVATVRPLRRGPRHSEQTIGEFLRRIEDSPKLPVPGIANLRHVLLIQGRPHVFLDYADGLSIADVLSERGRPLDVPEALDWTRRILEAVAFAHRRGVAHGGLKPGNVVVAPSRGDGPSADPRIRVLDFGLGRIYQSSGLSGLRVLSGSHSHLGYAAPERIADFRNVLPAADLYSVAAILRFLLTGRPPYEFPPRFERQILMVLQDEPAPLADQRPDLPEAVIGFIDQGLAYGPKDRFSNADAMLAELATIAASG